MKRRPGSASASRQEELGEEHLRSGNPIFYTSADSVLQIAAHEEVISIGRLFEIYRMARKAADRFAGQGVTQSFPTASNRNGMETIDRLWEAKSGGLLFANLVDFDMLFGHRRDVAGYGEALTEFDDWLSTFLPRVSPNDLIIITADHGNDPTFPGTDHTREEVPLFVLHQGASRDLGQRESFGRRCRQRGGVLGLPKPWPTGESFLTACTSQA